MDGRWVADMSRVRGESAIEWRDRVAQGLREVEAQLVALPAEVEDDSIDPGTACSAADDDRRPLLEERREDLQRESLEAEDAVQRATGDWS